MAILNATSASYRFLVLFFNCMLTFGSYFCFDMPSVLQDVFTETNNCTNASDPNCNNCTDCLGMSDSDYNLLYAIYAWTNAVVVIGAGYLIDKFGNRVGVFLFSALCLVGSSVFAAGIFLKGTSAMLPVMLLGRLLFGSGNGSLTIVQNRITAYWFKNKELAMAFGITLAFSRLGSVLNFFCTQMFEESFGLAWTLWGGAMLCLLGFLSAIIVSMLDSYGVRQLGDEGSLQTESKKLVKNCIDNFDNLVLRASSVNKITDIKKLSLSFWLLALTIMFFYNGVFPFVADASKFIKTKYGEKYHLSDRESSYLSGAVYDVSMVISPFLGGMIDVIGKRGYLALLTAVLTIPVFGLLAFSDVYPLVATVWLGLTYSFAAASMWPSIPLVVTQATVGTAMGLTTSIQMIGIGISNVVVGQILGSNSAGNASLGRWKLVMIFLLANTILCIITTIFLNINDGRKGGILNISRKQKQEMARQEKELKENQEFSDGEEDPLLPGNRHTNRYLRDGNALN